MEVKGICTICGNAAKLFTCSLCGSLVCCQCFDPSKGVCKLCQGRLRINKKMI